MLEPSLLFSGGLEVGSMPIPWSIIILLAIVVVGLLLIRTAFTLVKVAILVAIAVGIYLLVKFAFNEFS
jgi:hypothetical protein